MDFGSHLGSIFSHFAIILHSFFQHRFRIDFSLISGWIWHWFSILFWCAINSVPEPREPCFFTTVSRSAPKSMLLTSSIFLVVPLFFGIKFALIFTSIWISFFIISGAQNREKSAPGRRHPGVLAFVIGLRSTLHCTYFSTSPSQHSTFSALHLLSTYVFCW